MYMSLVRHVKRPMSPNRRAIMASGDRDTVYRVSYWFWGGG